MSITLFTAPLGTITVDDVHAFLDLELEESTRLDYKEAEKNNDGPPSSMLNVIVAFANSQGGLLVLGVEADKRTNRPIKREGLNFLKRGSLEEAITSRCYSSIIPPLAPEIGVYPFKSPTSLGELDRAFVVIRVQPSATVHSTKENCVLVRVNSECQNADLMTLRFLLEREQKREEMVKLLSTQVLDGYWSAREQFGPEFRNDEQKWKPFSERIYMECVPLDASADLLPFGLQLTEKSNLDTCILDALLEANWAVCHRVMRPRGLILQVDVEEPRFGTRSERNPHPPLAIIYFDKSGGIFVNLAVSSLGAQNAGIESKIQRLCLLNAKLITILHTLLREHDYVGRVETQIWTASETWSWQDLAVDDPRHRLQSSKRNGHFGSAVYSLLDQWPEQSQKIGRMVSQLTRSWLEYSFRISNWDERRPPELSFGE